VTRKQREIVNRIVDALLDVSPEKRPVALDALCAGIDAGDDARLIRAEAERLLAADEAIENRLADFVASRPSGSAVPTATGGIRTTQTGAAVGAASGAASVAGVPVDALDLEPVPSIVGRYHIRSLLGRGGMGRVFLAEQRAPIRRQVALKLIRYGFESHAILARFDAERQALARMDHPNVARVLDAGMSDEGRPFFAMELVNGKPITEFADEQRLTIRQRLELFAQACDAVAHAHTKGVIHRDVKPSNVLAFQGEDGKPTVKVIDFGVAKAISGDRGAKVSESAILTETGMAVGTVAYMSPEQAAMSSDIDTRTDVYSLGVLLYELLVGVRPFESPSDSSVPTDELRRRIREEDAPKPSTQLRWMARGTSSTHASHAIPKIESVAMPERVDESIAAARGTRSADLVRTLQRELEWIPMMALRRERQRRYAGPGEMAADVRNYLAGDPLIAAPESRGYRFRKFVSRHWSGIAVVAALLLLLVGGIVGTTSGMIRAQSARELANANEQRATRSAYRSAVVAAAVALKSGDSVQLREALAAAPVDMRGWEWNYLNTAGVNVVSVLRAEPNDRFRTSVALPDNRRAVSSNGRPEGSTVLWDLRTGRVIRREVGGQFAVDRKGERLAIVRPDGALDLCELETGKPFWRAPASATGKPWQLVRASFSPDADQLIAWDESPTSIALFDAVTGKMSTLESPVSIGWVMGVLKVAGEPARVAIGPKGSASTIVIDPATGAASRDPRIAQLLGDQAIAEAGENTWAPWQWVGDARPEFNFDDAPLPLWQSVYLPNRRLIACGRSDGSVDLVPARGDRSRGTSLARTRKLLAGSEQINAIAATPDESQLLVNFANGDVAVLHVEATPEVRIAMPSVSQTAISHDRSAIVGIGWGTVQCVDVFTGLPLWGRNLGPAFNRFVAWSPDDARVVVLSDARDDGLSDVFVLDARTGEQLAAWCDSPVTPDPIDRPRRLPWARNIAGVAFDPDGKSLLIARNDGTIARVDPNTWTEMPADVATTPEPAWPSSAEMSYLHYGALEMSPDGSLLAQLTMQRGDRALLSGPVTLRDARTARVARRIGLPAMGATAMAWSSTSDRIAIAFWNASETRFVVADARSGSLLMNRATGSTAPILSLTFSGDGGRLIVINGAGRLTVNDASTGEELLSLLQSQANPLATFTSDGAIVASGGSTLIRRLESRQFASPPAKLAERWPSGVPLPATVDELRRAVVAATEQLQRAYVLSTPVEAFLDQFAKTDPATAALARAIASRYPPNINVLNSQALQVLQSNSPTDDDLARAAEMLKRAVAIKPHSANLNANLGSALFARGRYAECMPSLQASERLRAERGMPPAVGSLLRLAIAARLTGDARAAELAADAHREVEKQSAGNDPETIELLQMLRQAQPH
jgi:serine/threonine protein kinase/WD40 repeat protein